MATPCLHRSPRSATLTTPAAGQTSIGETSALTPTAIVTATLAATASASTPPPVEPCPAHFVSRQPALPQEGPLQTLKPAGQSRRLGPPQAQPVDPPTRRLCWQSWSRRWRRRQPLRALPPAPPATRFPPAATWIIPLNAAGCTAVPPLPISPLRKPALTRCLRVAKWLCTESDAEPRRLAFQCRRADTAPQRRGSALAPVAAPQVGHQTLLVTAVRAEPGAPHRGRTPWRSLTPCRPWLRAERWRCRQPVSRASQTPSRLRSWLWSSMLRLCTWKRMRSCARSCARTRLTSLAACMRRRLTSLRGLALGALLQRRRRLPGPAGTQSRASHRPVIGRAVARSASSRSKWQSYFCVRLCRARPWPGFCFWQRLRRSR